jgi:uncharacterized membrane protein YsdA (DUF1294 family)
MAVTAGCLFLVVICGLAARGTVPLAVAALYLGASAAAFVVYGLDKTAARANARRTPEVTLHLIALVGGWPGALVAQRVFHHKSRKLSFQVVFWATVALNCAALVWFSQRL